MSSTFLSREEQNLSATPLKEIIEKLEEGLRKILATRYGIEIIELEELVEYEKEIDGQHGFDYLVIAMLDTDYFDDKRINAVFTEIIFTHFEGDTSDNIEIKKAHIIVRIADDYSKPDSVEATFNLSLVSGLAYRIALQAIVDKSGCDKRKQ
jgi:hypothetical protein